ncbi:MAG: serine/threonine-protein phosphatase [Christensenellaceae bacterium]|nr:serine/threonine-protein phosphatase [Christensenellaceae bacterium]
MKRTLENLEDLSVLINSLEDLVRVVRPDHTVAMVNDAMRETLGCEFDVPCYATLGHDAPCQPCLMRMASVGRKYFVGEREINGCYYSIKASPLHDKNGNFLGCIEVYRDMTTEVRLRSRLLRTNSKMKQDLMMAQQLQKAMFRMDLQELEGYRFSLGFFPCDAVGGDACDCIKLPDGRVLFYVADVSGHGVRAAMLTVFIRQEILMQVKEGMELKDMPAKIRESFMELNADEETYITMFMVMLDPKTGECEYINVGHSVSPIVLNSGKINELFIPGVPICRWAENAGSEVGRVTLEKGDRIAIFTDGVMERCERIDSEKFFCDNFARRNFDASEFIQEVKTIHVKNRADDILLMICERTA